MDQGSTGVRPSRTAAPHGAVRPGRYRSQQPHHRRRRRALALTAVVALLLVVVIAAAGLGGGSVQGAAVTSSGFFTRIQTLAGTGPGSFSAAQKSAESAAIDRTLAVMPYVRMAGAQHREVALTFDDGPGPYTPQVLSVLQRMNAAATFFQVGIEETYFNAATSQILAAGYPIGDHTESHAAMGKLALADQETQLVRQISATGPYGVPFPRLFRPPYGSWNQTTLTLLRKYRMLMVLWSIDTGDYRRPGTQTIVDSVLSNVRPGAIVLMHDAGGARSETVAALPQIISALQARGYKLVTVPQLLRDNPPPVNQQVVGLAGSGG